MCESMVMVKKPAIFSPELCNFCYTVSCRCQNERGFTHMHCFGGDIFETFLIQFFT